MSQFVLEISRTAEKQITKLDAIPRNRIIAAIQKLVHDPFPSGCRKLSGYEDIFRIRVGDYRVLYSVEKKRLVIIILKVGNRREVYR